MGGKWMELLKELAPRLERTAALFNPRTHTGQYWSVLEAAARSLDVTFAKAAVEDAAAIGPAIAAMAGEPGGGLLVMPELLQHEPSRDDRRFGRAAPRAGDLRVSRVPRQRRPDLVRA